MTPPTGARLGAVLDSIVRDSRKRSRRSLVWELQYRVLGELRGIITDGELGESELDWLDSIYEALAGLAELADQALSLVRARLGDEQVLRKIETLRNPDGRTPAEAATARKLADRLEQKLRNRLEEAQS
jgi:hypothetical protein